MAIRPTITLNGSMPSLGALLGTVGTRAVAQAVEGAGQSIDWSRYNQSRVAASRAFQEQILLPALQASERLAQASTSFVKDPWDIPWLNDSTGLSAPTFGMMDFIMSIPEVNTLAMEGRISAYGLTNDAVQGYANNAAPYDLFMNDIGFETILEHDEDSSPYGFTSTTMMSDDPDIDARYEGFAANTDRVLNARQLKRTVLELLETTLLDPTAPDYDRG